MIAQILQLSNTQKAIKLKNRALHNLIQNLSLFKNFQTLESIRFNQVTEQNGINEMSKSIGKTAFHDLWFKEKLPPN